MKGDAAVKAVAGQPWDPSVQSLVAFPQVLAMMGEQPDWVQKLGDAFLAQPERRDGFGAAAAGDGAGGGQPQVRRRHGGTKVRRRAGRRATSADAIIMIEPASPQVVYVPVYNPTVGLRHLAVPDVSAVLLPAAAGLLLRDRAVTGIACGTGIASPTRSGAASTGAATTSTSTSTATTTSTSTTGSTGTRTTSTGSTTRRTARACRIATRRPASSTASRWPAPMRARTTGARTRSATPIASAPRPRSRTAAPIRPRAARRFATTRRPASARRRRRRTPAATARRAPRRTSIATRPGGRAERRSGPCAAVGAGPFGRQRAEGGGRRGPDAPARRPGRREHAVDEAAHVGAVGPAVGRTGRASRGTSRAAAAARVLSAAAAVGRPRPAGARRTTMIDPLRSRSAACWPRSRSPPRSPRPPPPRSRSRPSRRPRPRRARSSTRSPPATPTGWPASSVPTGSATSRPATSLATTSTRSSPRRHGRPAS